MVITAPGRAPITNRIIGGKYENGKKNLLYFTQDGVFKCSGYLIAWKLALGSGRCFYEKDICGLKASNKRFYSPKLDSQTPDSGWCKPFYMNSVHVIPAE